LNLLEREKVTIFAAVPTMYQMLTTAPNWETADLSSLRFCTSGGAPLPVPLVEKYTKEKNIRFKQGFGMTEFGPGIFALAPEDAIRKAGSIGRPNFFVDAQIVNEQNQILGPNEAGELVLKGLSYCSGYFNNPEATQAALMSTDFSTRAMSPCMTKRAISISSTARRICSSAVVRMCTLLKLRKCCTSTRRFTCAR
jgi:fatty-acyl-CoA synthase